MQEEEEEVQIGDEDMLDLIADLLAQAQACITEQGYPQALEKLSSCEGLLTLLKERGVDLEFKLLVSLLTNLAFCYEQTDQLVEASAYLEACVFNYRQQITAVPLESSLERLTKSIGFRKAYAKTSIQLLALHSRLGRHTAALKTAKAAITETTRCLQESLLACKAIAQQGKGRPSGGMKLAEKAASVYTFLLTTLQTSKVVKAPQLSNRSPLGVQMYKHWVYNFNIGDFAKLTPASSAVFSIEEELGVDGLYQTVRLT
jgi:tetratricopeptide (TPR) repeat protein